jgi:hypothetical protein
VKSERKVRKKYGRRSEKVTGNEGMARPINSLAKNIILLIIPACAALTCGQSV